MAVRSLKERIKETREKLDKLELQAKIQELKDLRKKKREERR